MPVHIVLDLSSMVLLLKEHLDGDNKRLKIRNARQEVENPLRIGNFDKLMELGCA